MPSNLVDEAMDTAEGAPAADPAAVLQETLAKAESCVAELTAAIDAVKGGAAPEGAPAGPSVAPKGQMAGALGL